MILSVASCRFQVRLVNLNFMQEVLVFCTIGDVFGDYLIQSLTDAQLLCVTAEY